MHFILDITNKKMEKARRLSYRDVVRLGLASTKGFSGITTELESIASERHLNRVVIDVPFVPPIIILNHPDDIDAVWKMHQEKLDKQGTLYDSMREMFGSGHVLSKRDASWSTLKKITTPTLRPASMDNLGEKSVQAVDGALDYFLSPSTRSGAKASINVHRVLKVASAQISTQMIFGMNFPTYFVDKLTEDLTFLNEYVAKKPLSLNVTERVRKMVPLAFKRVTQAHQLLYGTVGRILNEGNSPLMNALRNHGPEGDGILTRADQVGEIINTLVASYGNIANAMAWSVYYLSTNRNQSLQSQVIEEHSVGKKPYEEDATVKHVFDESLRLYAPVYLVTRKATEDMDVRSNVGDIFIPKGSMVVFSPYLLHRNPQVWENPQEFNPKRFEESPSKNSFLPFGYGDRACSGVQFSYYVGTQILEHLVLNYNFSLDDTANVTPVFLTNISPKQVKLKIEKRK